MSPKEGINENTKGLTGSWLVPIMTYGEIIVVRRDLFPVGYAGYNDLLTRC